MIISQLVSKGITTYRVIREEVMARLSLPTYSLDTVKKDFDSLLQEWKEERLDNVEDYINLELAQIEHTIQEAWDAWERSKSPKTKSKMLGTTNGKNSEKGDDNAVNPTKLERIQEEHNECGDPRYLEAIHRECKERRKLLGLYAPDKQDISCSEGIQINFRKYKND